MGSAVLPDAVAIWGAAGIAGFAVWLWLGRPRLARVTADRGGVRRRRAVPWRGVAFVLIMMIMALVAGLVFGSTAATLIVVAGIVAGSCAHQVQTVRARRRAEHRAQRTTEACRLLGQLVAVGLNPVEALGVAATESPALADAAAYQRIGGDPSELWRAMAEQPGGAGWRALAQAWQVSWASGASVVRPLRDVAAGLRSDERLGQIAKAELAAPRATARLLAVLPAFGILLGFGVGGQPVAFLIGHWAGQVCLVVGMMLAALGVTWVDRLAAKALPA